MPRPGPLDFQALADGVVRNNVGVDAIEFAVKCRIADAAVTALPTGQTFALAAASDGSTAHPDGAWGWFRVTGHGAGERVALVYQGHSEGPDRRPEAGGRR